MEVRAKQQFMKITVRFEERSDGGLRAWSGPLRKRASCSAGSRRRAWKSRRSAVSALALLSLNPHG